MTRMLMSAAYEGSHSNPKDDEDGPKCGRTAQRMRERRQWQKEAEMPEDEAAQADRDGDPETDCRHGCNGDCLISGSDVCTWQCHTWESVQGYCLAKIRELEEERAATDNPPREEELSREIYARKMALANLACDEMTRMTQGWED